MLLANLVNRQTDRYTTDRQLLTDYTSSSASWLKNCSNEWSPICVIFRQSRKILTTFWPIYTQRLQNKVTFCHNSM